MVFTTVLAGTMGSVSAFLFSPTNKPPLLGFFPTIMLQHSELLSAVEKERPYNCSRSTERTYNEVS